MSVDVVFNRAAHHHAPASTLMFLTLASLWGCVGEASSVPFAGSDVDAGSPSEQRNDSEQRNGATEVGVVMWGGEKHEVEYRRNEFGEAIVGGDIVIDPLLLPDPQAEEPSEGNIGASRQGLHVYPDHLWPNRVVPYTIVSLSDRSHANVAMKHWSEAVGFTFVPRTSESSYMEIRGRDSGGCTGTLGRHGGVSTVSIGPNCNHTSVFIHEIGHIVSLWHEHSRADRDAYVNIHWNNISSDARSAFSISTPGEAVGPYDYLSIMHYTSHAFSANGNPTITRKDSSQNLSGDWLSPGDVEQLNKLHAHVDGCSTVSRIAGSNRYATAVEVSRSAYSSAAAVMLVSGATESQIDAVTAAPLARRLRAPILLTSLDAVPNETLSEIQRLGAKNVYIVGGSSVVSAGVEETLKQRGYAVQRLSGPSRYATAASVARAFSAAGDVSTAYIVSGAAMPDAVVASAAGAALGRPVLLVRPDAIPTETQQALSSLGITNTIVIGGATVVSDSVLASLPSAKRIGGQDRYHTAQILAGLVRSEVPGDQVLVARGDMFIDAIVGGALGVPMLLSQQNEAHKSMLDFVTADKPTEITLLGGEAALTRRVENQTCYYLGRATP